MNGFKLKNSALLFPGSGFDQNDDHFSVLLDDTSVGTIYRVGEEWVWSINLGMMGITSGWANDKNAARAAFRAAWDERAGRLGADHVARAIAVARGRKP